MSFLGPRTLRTLSDPSKFGSEALFTTPRVESFKALLENDDLDFRMRQKWNGILAADNNAMPLGPIDPFNPPEYYEDPEGNEEFTSVFQGDATRAVDLGIRWRVFRDPADAEAVRRLVFAWSDIGSIANTGAARLIWSNRWPMFIQAARLIEDSPSFTPGFKTAMQGQTLRGLDYSTAYVQTENRAMWGVVLEIASASYLEDRDRMLRAIERWRELFDTDVRDNIPHGEILRGSNGLYYCNFLMNAMTQAAEFARFNGEWLYDYESPDGSTFKGLWETVAGWTAHPETYTYWPGSSTVRIQAHVEPLHALWPNPDSQLLIDTYTTTQDYYGLRQGILAYRYRPFWD